MTIRPFDEAEALETIMDLVLSQYPAETPTNFFQVGTGAAIAKTASQILLDAGHLATITAREARENTMTHPDNIYALARYNHSAIVFAKPAQASAIITIPIASLGDATVVRFTTSDQITFNNQRYVLPHDLIIDRTGVNIRAYYDTDIPSALATVLDPDCQVLINTLAGRPHVSVITRIVQAQRTVSRFQMIGNDVLRRNSFDVSFEGQLVNHILYYDESGNASLDDLSLKSLERIPLVITTLDALQQGESRSAFVNYISQNTVRFTFSASTNNFRPRIGSALIAVLYSSNGASGVTASTIAPRMTSKALNRAVVINTGGPLLGGVDRPSTLQVKIDAIEANLTRKGRDTDFDIQKAIDERVASLSNSSYRFQVFHTQHDVQRNAWGASVVLRGPDDLVVPARTESVRVSLDELEARGWSLPINTPVIYDPKLDQFRLVYDDETIPNSPANNDPIFVLPFAAKIITTPFPMLVLIRSSVDDTYSLKFHGSNSKAKTIDMLLGDLRVYRDASRERRYTVRVKGVQIGDSGALGSHRAAVIIHDHNRVVGWRELPEWNASAGMFTGFLETADAFVPATNRYILTNLRSMDTGAVLPSVDVGENLWFEIVLLAERSTAPVEPFTFKSGSSLYVNRLVSNWSTIASASGLEAFVPVATYATELTSEYPSPVGTISLWKSLTAVSSYDVSITSEGLVTLRNLPLLHASYLRTSMRVSHFNKAVGDLVGVLEDIRDILHTSTSIELLFTNTHGPSYSTTAANLAIDIHVVLRTYRELTTEETLAIKKAIVSQIESVNNTRGLISTFAFSNLATALEQQFAVIRSIVLVRLGGDTRQIIEAANVDRTDLLPEYLCVTRKPDSNTDEFNPDITISFN